MMLKELEKTSVRKGLVKDCYDWARVDRDDIYRQRVLGTRTGADEFIVYDDQRRHTWCQLIVFVVFICIETSFVYDRVDIGSTFQVNDALRGAIADQVFDWTHSPRYLKDVGSTEDLQDWLVNFFPTLLVPEVHGQNRLLGDVRLSLRRAARVESTDERFKAVAPFVWKNQDGSDPEDRSSDLDETGSFGMYRVWNTNQQDQSAGLGLNWCGSQTGARCPASAKELEVLSLGANAAAAEAPCKRRCEELNGEGEVCSCIDVEGDGTCRVYSVHVEQLQAAASGSCPAGALSPKDLRTGAGSTATAYWPNMVPFTHTSAGGSGGLLGWKETPGYVLSLKVVSQDKLDARAAGSGTAAPTQAISLQSQVQDWVSGGLLSQGMTSLVVDFVVHNPNYQTYSWVQLVFQETPTGVISSKLGLSTLRITSEQINAKNLDFLAECTGWDVIFVVILAVYLFLEVVQILHRGVSPYFSSLANCFTLLMLAGCVAILVSRSTFLSKTPFTKVLKDLTDTGIYNNDFQSFSEQYVEYDKFRYIAGMCSFILWLKLICILYDLVPHVYVLVNAGKRALTPIVLTVVIVIHFLVAFSMFGYLAFGGMMGPFSSWKSSFVTCTEFLFGTLVAQGELTEKFPVIGSLFFFVYVILFFCLAHSLSKAIILTSYSDAVQARLHELRAEKMKRRRALELHHQDLVTRATNRITALVKWVRDRTSGTLVAHTQTTRVGPSYFEGWLFVIQLTAYLLLIFYMTNTGHAFEVSGSITAALRDSTFSKTNPLTGVTTSAFTFDDILTRTDVERFLQEALPKTFFETSPGHFDGTDNPLKSYTAAAPDHFDQLVINNWNLVVGQEPVRISFRYHAMEAVQATESLGSVVPVGELMPSRDPLPTTVDSSGLAFDPPLVEAKTLAEIKSVEAQTTLGRRCKPGAAYGSAAADEQTGFACMLSVNRNTTDEILQDIVEGDVLNRQIAVAAVDFLVYNGFAETFTYVAVVFKFQPSGTVGKDIMTYTTESGYYSSNRWYRVVFEVFFALLNFYFFGLSVRWLGKAVWMQISVDRKKGDVPPSTIAVQAVRSVLANASLDPFSMLDLISCIMNFIIIAMWFDVVFAKVASQTVFFFPERPNLPGTPCQMEWCTDEAVLMAFHKQGHKFRTFRHTLGIATVIMVFRVLKYLQIFPRVQDMFLTFHESRKELRWLLLCVFLLFFAYVSLGHQAFGMRMKGFSSIPFGIFTCFELFLGTFDFDNFGQGASAEFFLFVYSFIILFRFVILNLFFAIIDCHFRKVIDKSSTAYPGLNPFRMLISLYRREIRIPDIFVGKQLPAGLHSTYLEAVAEPLDVPPSPSRRGSSEGSSPANANLKSLTFDTVAQSVEVEDDDSPTRRTSHGSGQTDDELAAKISNKVHIWRHLPDQMQVWALKTSAELSRHIREWHRQRLECGIQPTRVEKLLEDVEVEMNVLLDQLKNKADHAKRTLEMKQLRSLKEIHEDQESLAWYIMKQEGKLKTEKNRLAAAKNRKEGRLQQAAIGDTDDVT